MQGEDYPACVGPREDVLLGVLQAEGEEEEEVVKAGISQAEWDWKMQASFVRYKRLVEREGFTCQECGGAGGEGDVVMDYGQGPWMPCLWCQGLGKFTRFDRSQWLSYQKWKKNQKAKREGGE